MDGPLFTADQCVTYAEPIVAPGEMLAHYRILDRLGAGGMGVEQVADRGRYSLWGLYDQGLAVLDPNARRIERYRLPRGPWERAAAVPGDGNLVTWGIPAFAVSRDGALFLWVQVDRVEGDLMLVENFR